MLENTERTSGKERSHKYNSGCLCQACRHEAWIIETFRKGGSKKRHNSYRGKHRGNPGSNGNRLRLRSADDKESVRESLGGKG